MDQTDRPLPPTPPPEPADVPEDRPFTVADALRPRRAAEVREHQISPSELLLTRGDRQVLHALSPTAWAIWDLCDGSHTVREIAETLARDAAAPLDTVLPDVREAVRRLGALSLLDAA